MVIGHKNGALQCLQQGAAADVGVGIVDEHTGVHVAVDVDVQIALSACDAAAHIFRVILKIHGEQRLFRPQPTDAAIDRLALPGGGQQLVGKRFVDERTIGEAQKDAVAVFFAQANQVGLADQRLSAGVDVHIHAQLFALADDAVYLVEGQVQPVAVFRRPAAGAMEVAGGGGGQKNGPRDVALILGPTDLLLAPADHAGVDKQVDGDGLHDLRVHVLDDMEDILVIGVAGVLDGLADDLALNGEISVVKAVCPVHDLQQIALRVSIEIVKGLLQAKFFYGVCYVHTLVFLSVSLPWRLRAEK